MSNLYLSLLLFFLCNLFFFVYFFFFSSRRRHTRSKRDWSSDVCSSDLPASSRRGECPAARFARADTTAARRLTSRAGRRRSEERRVGKECRSRWGRE